MKHIFKSVIVLTVIAASFVTFSAFESKTTKAADSYVISLLSKETVGGNTTWSWSLVNPNPGNGNNGTLQDVSHWSVPLNAACEAALVSAESSYDGVNWASVSTSVDRDPSIRACTTVDVLKYDRGTSGIAPTYFRATFNTDFVVNPWATSWIKTGGGLQGCNMYFFSGMGAAVN
jgi:hypothetical protein